MCLSNSSLLYLQYWSSILHLVSWNFLPKLTSPLPLYCIRWWVAVGPFVLLLRAQQMLLLILKRYSYTYIQLIRKISNGRRNMPAVILLRHCPSQLPSTAIPIIHRFQLGMYWRPISLLNSLWKCKVCQNYYITFVIVFVICYFLMLFQRRVP